MGQINWRLERRNLGSHSLQVPSRFCFVFFLFFHTWMNKRWYEIQAERDRGGVEEGHAAGRSVWHVHIPTGCLFWMCSAVSRKGTQKATLSQRQRDRPGGEMRHTHIFPQGPKPLGVGSTSRLRNTGGCWVKASIWQHHTGFEMDGANLTYSFKFRHYLRNPQ